MQEDTILGDGLSKSSCIIILFVILWLISVILNIWSGYSIQRFKTSIGTECCELVEDINTQNEAVKNIIDGALKNNGTEYEELLILLKNLDDLSGSLERLEQEYNSYSDNSINILKKDQEIDIKNIYYDISEYVKVIIKREMTENSNTRYIFSGSDANYFYNINGYITDIDDFFKDFYQNKVNETDKNERKNVIIKKEYWIDALKEINNINEKYENIDLY